MAEHTICPWCQSEIVWDEEIGPEEFCPHCDNELSGYRTVQVGLDRDDEEDAGEDRWDETGEEELKLAAAPDGQGGWYEVDQAVRELVDRQEEAPECPECREYMVELGEQTIQHSFRPKVHDTLGQTLLELPIRTVLYVCPACYRTASVLAQEDRERMIERLTPKK